MALRPQRFGFFLSAFALLSACGSSTPSNDEQPGLDNNGDRLADDLGALVDANPKDGAADSIDANKDGKADGPGVDTNKDGKVDGLALDTDCDGFYESVDINGDGQPDVRTGRQAAPAVVPTCKYNPFEMTGTGGSSGTAGSSSTAGTTSMGGSTGTGGSTPVASQLGKATYQGTGNSSDQYAEADVLRNGVGYKFIANGWGSGWQNHSISWNGTSFKVASLNGTQGSNYSPAGYPTMFCGLYSMKQSQDMCGLPANLASLQSVKTGWRWQANGNGGQYNAAWDIWLGNGDSLSAYLMVWLRDPPGQQPAGAAATAGATVQGLPGQWKIWTGSVNGHPIVNYVKDEGQDLAELEYDVMDVYRDAIKRGYNLPGNKILAVAIGYEVWNGPVTNLVTDDFYVDVK
jgi:hypothetical protein